MRTLRGGMAVAAFVGILSVGRASASEIVTIDFPGAVLTDVFGVNPQGDVVGRYLGADGRFHGFVATNGVFATITLPASGIMSRSPRGPKL